MIEMRVLGPGCPNCKRVELHATQAIEQWRATHPDEEITIEKLTDPARFLDYGLLSTPGLVINKRLVSAGRIPAPADIVAWLDEAALE